MVMMRVPREPKPLPKHPPRCGTPDMLPPKGGLKDKLQEAIFKQKDANHDGSLSRDEYVGKKEGIAKLVSNLKFTAKDTNKDGKLSLDEFKAGKGGKTWHPLPPRPPVWENPGIKPLPYKPGPDAPTIKPLGVAEVKADIQKA